MLAYKCKRLGINFVLQEEAYTSKCDALAFESIEKHESYKGSRIKRGLFKSSVGKLINADINGALNILRKFLNSSKGTGEFSVLQKIIGSGLVVRPVRITGNGIEAKLCSIHCYNRTNNRIIFKTGDFLFISSSFL